jgi:hypothetical protein
MFENSEVAAGLGNANREPLRGETTVWQIVQMFGRAPLKNCCL